MGTIQLIANTPIKGIITDNNHQPLENAIVYIPELQKGTTSNAQGEFYFTDLPKSRITIQVSFLGFHTEVIKVEPGLETSLAIVLEPSPITSSELVVSAGAPSSQHHTAIRIDDLKALELELSASPTLIGTLTKVPGVDMISKGPGIATPVIRGLSTSNILVLSDGFRLENYQFSDHHPYPVSEYGLDKIEVIKGPASLLFGSDAIGGVINTISEKPAAYGKISGDANLRYLSNTNGVDANLGLKGTNSLFYWGLRGGLKSNEDYKDGEGNHVPNTRFNESNLKTFAGFSKSYGSFRLNYALQNQTVGISNEAIPEMDLENGRENEVWYQDLTNHLVTSKNTFFLNNHTLNVDAAYQNNHRILMEDADEKLVDMRLQTVNYKVQDKFDISAHTNLLLALQGMHQQNTNGEAHERVLPDFVLNDYSAFGLIQHEWNEALHFQGGIRFDGRSLEIPTQEKSGGHSHGEEDEQDHDDEDHDDDDHDDEDEVFEALNRNFSNVSASAGVTYHINEHLNFRTNLASAFRAPNVAELSQDGAHGTRYEKGNRDLNPQRNYEWDLSFHYHNDFLLVDISAYYNYIEQYIFLDKTADTTEAGQVIYEYQQADASIYGMEMYFETMPLSWLNFNGSASYIRGQQHDGSNLPFIPHNNIKLNAAYKYSGNKSLKNLSFIVGPEINFAQNNAALFETKTPGFVLWNAGLETEWKIAKQKVFVSLQGNNLLNTQYQNHLSTLKDLGYYNVGRNMVFNLRVPF